MHICWMILLLSSVFQCLWYMYIVIFSCVTCRLFIPGRGFLFPRIGNGKMSFPGIPGLQRSMQMQWCSCDTLMKIKEACNIRVSDITCGQHSALQRTDWLQSIRCEIKLWDYLPPWLSGLVISELQCSESMAGLFGRAWVRLPGWYSMAWVRLLPAPLGSSVGHEFDYSRPCPQHVKSGFQHVNEIKSRAGIEGSPVSS